MGKEWNRIKNWFEKRDYKAFDKYLDEAERWRHRRARKDERNYPNGLAPNYDDRLQRQYLNFKTHKFQLRLTVLTIIGMLVSGLLSGWVVFKLTNEENPLIVVSEPVSDPIKKTLNISVSNSRDNLAYNVLVYYRILGLERGGIWIGEIPSLFKETKQLTLDLSSTNSIIIREAEAWFLLYYKENNSVGIGESKDYIISGLGFNTEYNLQILVYCSGGCDTILPEPIDYEPNIYCKIEKNITKCDIRGSSGL